MRIAVVVAARMQQFRSPATLGEQTRVDKEGGFANTGEAANVSRSPSRLLRNAHRQPEL